MTTRNWRPFGFALFFLLFSSALSFSSETLQYLFRNPDLQEETLRLARDTITKWAKDKKKISLPTDIPEAFHRQAGVFVSIEKKGSLRGCRGTIYPGRSFLGDEIIDNAIQAAFKDPRFPPVEKGELKDLKIIVTIVLGIEEVFSIEDLNPREYGLLVKAGDAGGVMLPFEAPTPRKQLEWAKKRGGIPSGTPVQMFKIRAVRFAEK